MNYFEMLEGDVLDSIRMNLGLEANDNSKDAKIEQMSADELFERYMAWHGIIGFESAILQAVNDIRDAFADTRAPDEWPYNSDYLF